MDVHDLPSEFGVEKFKNPQNQKLVDFSVFLDNMPLHWEDVKGHHWLPVACYLSSIMLKLFSAYI
jgi:hypothetical protein